MAYLKKGLFESGDNSRPTISHTSFKSAAIFQLISKSELPYTSVVQVPSRGLVHGFANIRELEMEDHGPVSTSPSPESEPRGPEDQFHHFIPRFVLKRFIGKSNAKKARHKSRYKAGRTEDYIYCYSTSEPSGSINIRPISKVFGVKNLYKDARNPKNAHELEMKLSDLESKASKVISDLLATVEKGARNSEASKGEGLSEPISFRTKRWNLNLLQKFLHIMSYRRKSLAKTYWQEDHPDNHHVRSWIQSFGKRNNIESTTVDIWLQVLRYYLDTPHAELVEHGRNARKELLIQYLDYPHSEFDEIDPSLEHYPAIEYMMQADGCFLAIWEAAPGEEFILSNNSFGLYEGKQTLWGPSHKFNVISPRIALVQCSVGFKPGFHGLPGFRENCQESMLRNATHKAPKTIYANGPPKFKNFDERLKFGAKEHTLGNDMMEFEISTLSVEHTHIVNAIILENVDDDGLITFRSKEALLRTLDSFGRNPNFNNHSKYAALVHELQQEVGGLVPFSALSSESEEEGYFEQGGCRAQSQESIEDNHIGGTFIQDPKWDITDSARKGYAGCLPTNARPTNLRSPDGPRPLLPLRVQPESAETNRESHKIFGIMNSELTMSQDVTMTPRQLKKLGTLEY